MKYVIFAALLALPSIVLAEAGFFPPIPIITLPTQPAGAIVQSPGNSLSGAQMTLDAITAEQQTARNRAELEARFQRMRLEQAIRAAEANLQLAKSSLNSVLQDSNLGTPTQEEKAALDKQVSQLQSVAAELLSALEELLDR